MTETKNNYIVFIPCRQYAFIKKIAQLLLSLIILLKSSIIFSMDFIAYGRLMETYDDNIYMTDYDQEYDFITNLMIGFRIEQIERIQRISLSGNVHQRLYYNNNELNNNYQDVGFFYERELWYNSQLQLSNEFQHYPEPLDFQSSFDRALSNQEGYYTNIFRIAYSKVFSRSVDASINYNNQINKYTSGDLTDSYSNGAGTRINYHLSNRIITSLLYNFNKTEYASGATIVTQSPEFHTVYYVINERLYFDGAFGIIFIKYDDNKYYNNWNIAGSLNYIADQNNRFNLSYIKTSTASVDNTDPYDTWTVTGTFDREFLQRLSLSFSSFYGEGKYISSGSLIKLFGLNCSLNYTFRENISLQTTYNYMKSSTSIENIDYASGTHVSQNSKYTRNQISISLSIEL